VVDFGCGYWHWPCEIDSQSAGHHLRAGRFPKVRGWHADGRGRGVGWRNEGGSGRIGLIDGLCGMQARLANAAGRAADRRLQGDFAGSRTPAATPHRLPGGLQQLPRLVRLRVPAANNDFASAFFGGHPMTSNSTPPGLSFMRDPSARRVSRSIGPAGACAPDPRRGLGRGARRSVTLTTPGRKLCSPPIAQGVPSPMTARSASAAPGTDLEDLVQGASVLGLTASGPAEVVATEWHSQDVMTVQLYGLNGIEV
jgi:hypothetical protein